MSAPATTTEWRIREWQREVPGLTLYVQLFGTTRFHWDCHHTNDGGIYASGTANTLELAQAAADAAAARFAAGPGINAQQLRERAAKLLAEADSIEARR